MARRFHLLLAALLGIAAVVGLRPMTALAQGGPDFEPRPGGPPVAAQPPTARLTGVRVAMEPRLAFRQPSPNFSEAPQPLSPWWEGPLHNQLRHDCRAIDISLDGTIMGALSHSAQVRVLACTPQIRREAITDQESRFDPQAFIDTRYTSVSDPVGSILTTGGPNRFLDENLYFSSGIKQTTATGGSLVVSQKIGYEDSNSLYFIPANQGTSRIDVALTQPLLNGAGCDYNSHGIVLAQIDANIARDQFAKDLQAFLADVHHDYWELYLARATLLQKIRLHHDAEVILNELNARSDMDVLQSQIVRARAAVAGREAGVIRGGANVDNAETKLRAAMNDAALRGDRPPELIPNQSPDLQIQRVDLRAALLTALERRPEINQATKELRAASVRAQVSANEMLPVLNLVLGSYVSGLDGNVDIVHAFSDQFTTGRPSYFGGVQFEMPLNNRGAVARNRQRELEVQQLSSNLEAVTDAVRVEVENSVREVATTYREMLSKREAMNADEAEIRYLTERWRLLPGDQQFAGVMLDDLLSAQERLAKAEGEFATAEVSYSVARVDLRRVTGTLLDDVHVDRIDNIARNLPLSNSDGNPSSDTHQPISATENRQLTGPNIGPHDGAISPVAAGPAFSSR
jgi:outer membrane protein TolC